MSCADLDRPFGLIQSHSHSAILSLPGFVSRSPPDNSRIYLVGSVGLCIRPGLCIKSLAQSRNETNSSWVSSGADKPCAIPRICASDCPFSNNAATIKVTHYQLTQCPVGVLVIGWLPLPWRSVSFVPHGPLDAIIGDAEIVESARAHPVDSE